MGSNSAETDAMYYFSMLVMPAIIYAGLVGNVFALFLICNSRLKRYASSQFLIALAVFDIGFLLTIHVLWLEALVGKNPISTANPFCCKFFMFTTQFCDFSSVWMVVLVCLERYAMLHYATITERYVTVKLTWIVIVITAAIGVGVSIWVLVATDVYRTKYGVVCDVTKDYEASYAIFNTSDSTLCCFIPSGIILTFNLMSAHYLWQMANAKSDQICARVHYSSQIHIADTDEGNAQVNIQEIERREPGPKHVRFGAGCKEKQHTKMIVLTSTLFVLLNLPSYIQRMAQQFDKPVGKEITHITSLLWYLHHAITFYVYTLYSKNARNELVLATIQFSCCGCCIGADSSTRKRLKLLVRKSTCFGASKMQMASHARSKLSNESKLNPNRSHPQVMCLIKWNQEDLKNFPQIGSMFNHQDDEEEEDTLTNMEQVNTHSTIETMAEINSEDK